MRRHKKRQLDPGARESKSRGLCSCCHDSRHGLEGRHKEVFLFHVAPSTVIFDAWLHITFVCRQNIFGFKGRVCRRASPDPRREKGGEDAGWGISLLQATSGVFEMHPEGSRSWILAFCLAFGFFQHSKEEIKSTFRNTRRVVTERYSAFRTSSCYTLQRSFPIRNHRAKLNQRPKSHSLPPPNNHHS